MLLKGTGEKGVEIEVSYRLVDTDAQGNRPAVVLAACQLAVMLGVAPIGQRFPKLYN